MDVLATEILPRGSIQAWPRREVDYRSRERTEFKIHEFEVDCDLRMHSVRSLSDGQGLKITRKLDASVRLSERESVPPIATPLVFDSECVSSVERRATSDQPLKLPFQKKRPEGRQTLSVRCFAQRFSLARGDPSLSRVADRLFGSNSASLAMAMLPCLSRIFQRFPRSAEVSSFSYRIFSNP